MAEQLFLLPGWGLGCAPLEPLHAALREEMPDIPVTIAPLPSLASADPRDWLDELDAKLPQDVWLGGWSLGGMLAAELAARRSERCRGLITLASNLRFVAGPGWSTAMSVETFAAFRQGCAADAGATLKRFSLLCAQGAAQPRELSRQLLAAAPQIPSVELLAGLDVLAALDTRAALQGFTGPQLHLFAEQDALVPAAASQALRVVHAGSEVRLIDRVSHAFPLEHPQVLAAAIQAFIREAAND
jgi:pimeloyl-[acyl-carrier protein] methyl ester esterase